MVSALALRESRLMYCEHSGTVLSSSTPSDWSSSSSSLRLMCVCLLCVRQTWRVCCCSAHVLWQHDHPAERELKLRVLEIYNHKLDERDMRKKFVLERNLLVRRCICMSLCARR